MKINQKVLIIPPHISTSWNQVSALHMNGQILVVSLTNGEKVEIPGLEPLVIDNIFNTHAAIIELENNDESQNESQLQMIQSKFLNPHSIMQPSMDQRIEIPFRIASFDELGSVLQHNPSQTDAPDIPKEILHKIVAITKIVAPTDPQHLPKPEPHCNCVHCQIARAVTQDSSNEVTLQDVQQIAPEEEVSSKDLEFQQWDITNSAKQLYTVINRLDSKEKYSVFLGDPVGCTCGKAGCEHIVAVLKS